MAGGPHNRQHSWYDPRMSEPTHFDFLNALNQQPIARRPVWLMRQAGRYLPEYRKLRAQTPDFVTFCKTPALCCEATLQPLRRFDLDAAIIFSDILTVVDAMGLDLQYLAGEGPVVFDPVRNEKDLARLQPVEDKLQYVADAVSVTKKELSVPLIGFAGSPWTVATYMVEGGSSKIFKEIKTMMYAQPKVLHALLQKLTDVTIDYLNMQIDAGADAIQIFDSWGGVLNEPCYQAFSLDYMQKILAGLKKPVPTILFTKGGGQWLELMGKTDATALGLDWTTDLAQAKNRIGQQKTLQGNLDPFALFGSKQEIAQQVKSICKVYGQETGHIFNLGHGINKDTPIESVQLVVDTIRECWG